MRWNSEFYTGESTPFLSRHKCSETTYSCSAKTFHKYYVPKKSVQVGELAVAFCGASSVFGEVKVTKRKGRKTYVAFNDKPNKLYLISKCVALPVINEFVRHKQNKRWYKVIAVSEVGTLKTVAVLKMNMPIAEKMCADKSADAANKSADATDKSENAADKSADAADKSDADKPENAADKSADAAADKAADAAADKAADATDKSENAADKSADNRLPVESARAAHAAAGRGVVDTVVADIAHKSASAKKEAEARKKAKKSFGAADGEVFWSYKLSACIISYKYCLISKMSYKQYLLSYKRNILQAVFIVL